MHITEIKVHGDHDEVYAITIKDDEAKCSCLAFVFHPEKPCKHMRFVADVMRLPAHA